MTILEWKISLENYFKMQNEKKCYRYFLENSILFQNVVS